MSELVDKHIKMENVDLERLKRLCTHRGDLSYIINKAIKMYLELAEREIGRKGE
jgi:hypothetical protein